MRSALADAAVKDKLLAEKTSEAEDLRKKVASLGELESKLQSAESEKETLEAQKKELVAKVSSLEADIVAVSQARAFIMELTTSSRRRTSPNRHRLEAPCRNAKDVCLQGPARTRIRSDFEDTSISSRSCLQRMPTSRTSIRLSWRRLPCSRRCVRWRVV
jgi:septal ring factor EnvC (AmiA/AmiB activator)